LAYVTFFGVVLTYYGLPINLFREVYMSFQSLKSRLLAFAKYRKLMASMNRFENIFNEEELDQVGRTCIICRDDMTLGDCKKLPGCGHAFHKCCLRDWLVQQQTCPTCRGDISAMEARARQEQQRQAAAEVVAAGAAAALEAPLHQEQELQGDHVQPLHPPRTAPVEGAPLSGAAADPARVAREVPGVLANRTRKSTPAEFPLETPLDQHIFPGLYQVSAADGARVIRDDGTVHRLILNDTGVVVTGSKWQVVKLEDDTKEMRFFLQVPDGWIPENELKPLMQLPA
jgi:E3 ubiquitin-protein ligase synoviolin